MRRYLLKLLLITRNGPSLVWIFQNLYTWQHWRKMANYSVKINKPLKCSIWRNYRYLIFLFRNYLHFRIYCWYIVILNNIQSWKKRNNIIKWHYHTNENIFSCIDIWLKNIQISSSPVCCFPVDIPAAGQYNYIHQITLSDKDAQM